MLTKIRDVDLHLLRVFVAVAESGGIAAARDRLSVAASTISTQISHLETRLGFKLCKRGRGGFSLTPKGSVVLEHTYELIRDLQRFLSAIESTRSDLIGTVRIALEDSMRNNSELKLPEAFKILRDAHPQLRFEIIQCDPSEIGNVILNRKADVGVGWLPSSLPSLSVTELLLEPHVICCGRKHPLFDRAPFDIVPNELEKADWAQEEFFLRENVPFSPPPLSTASANHMEAIGYFILAGTHLGYLPMPYVSRWIDEGLIRTILPDQFTLQLPISLITRSDFGGDSKIRAVRKAIVDAHQTMALS